LSGFEPLLSARYPTPRLRIAVPVVVITSAVVAAIAAVLAGFLWNLAAAEPAAAKIDESRVAAARLARVCLFIVFGLALAFLGRRSRPPFLEACALIPATRPVRTYVAGFLIGALPVCLLIALLLAVGDRRFEVRKPGLLPWTLTKYLLLGIPFMLLEETIFRGLLLGDLIRAYGTTAATIVSSLFFAVTHFLGATDAWKRIPAKAAPTEAMVALFGGMERMVREWPELVGLVLVGLILCAARLRTGQLYLPMGIHAGWYWIKQVDGSFIRETPGCDQHRIWLGSGQYLDGVLGWCALLATLVLMLRIKSRTPSGAPTVGVPDLSRGVGP
jgi:membrane protease YdiL (CAAX protease family)